MTMATGTRPVVIVPVSTPPKQRRGELTQTGGSSSSSQRTLVVTPTSSSAGASAPSPSRQPESFVPSFGSSSWARGVQTRSQSRQLQVETVQQLEDDARAVTPSPSGSLVRRQLGASGSGSSVTTLVSSNNPSQNQNQNFYYRARPQHGVQPFQPTPTPTSAQPQSGTPQAAIPVAQPPAPAYAVPPVPIYYSWFLHPTQPSQQRQQQNQAPSTNTQPTQPIPAHSPFRPSQPTALAAPPSLRPSLSSPNRTIMPPPTSGVVNPGIRLWECDPLRQQGQPVNVAPLASSSSSTLTATPTPPSPATPPGPTARSQFVCPKPATPRTSTTSPGRLGLRKESTTLSPKAALIGTPASQPRRPNAKPRGRRRKGSPQAVRVVAQGVGVRTQPCVCSDSVLAPSPAPSF